MNKDYIESVDINIARKITLTQAKEFGVLPLYQKEDKVFILCSINSRRGEELLSFIYNKQLVYIITNEKQLNNTIIAILDYNIQEVEKQILSEAVLSKASDIHFEPNGQILIIRFRINGLLVTVRKLSIQEYNEISARLKIKANMDITIKSKPQDGNMQIKINNYIYNCRLSAIPVLDGEKIVIRIIYQENLLKRTEELSFSKRQQRLIDKMVLLKTGLFIINGPTGSGKSTTLYSILNSIKDQRINITTLEDPIEFKMDGINQVALNSKLGITFAEGLKSILRQDPDVIMLGEIRDEETAKMAVRAAITGHKVYSTIHTKSPREVYLRLEEMGAKAYLVRDAVCGIISQRLVRVLCDKCKKAIQSFRLEGNLITLYKKEGCSFCNSTGYSGRRLIAAVNYINKKKYKELNSIYSNQNILTNSEMEEGIIEMLKNGEIDYLDFKEFIEGEELNETRFQELIINC